MKDYERVAKLKKDLLRLTDDRNFHNADMNGWFHRMEKEKLRFAAFEEEFNKVIETKQKLLASLEERIMDIESEINSSVEKQISNAHERVGHEQCQYCFQWFNKGGLASHERYCGMNPTIQEKKPEKALEKIEDVLTNGELEELKTDQLQMLVEAKAAIEEKLRLLQESKKVEKEVPEPIQEESKEEVDTENGSDLSP